MTKPRTLPNELVTYRIGDPKGEFPVYSGKGAEIHPGRWNATGQDLIYTSEHYSTALLEKLIRLGELPAGQHYVEVAVPKGTSYEVVTDASLPGWYEFDAEKAKTFGARWFDEQRTAILLVPSLAARVDRNVLINPRHPDSKSIKPGLETPVPWDERLFSK